MRIPACRLKTMRFLSRSAFLVLLPFTVVLGACGLFSPPSASEFYQSHQPGMVLEKLLGSAGSQTSNALSSTFGSEGSSYEAEFNTSLTTSAYQGGPEALIQEYQVLLFQDLDAAGLSAEVATMEGDSPSQKWTYSSEEFHGEVSIRVTPGEDQQLVIEVWKSEQSN
jgi:hypothetical protein